MQNVLSSLNSPVESRLIIRIIFNALLSVNLTEYHEEVVALVALDEPCGTNEGLDVGAGVAALWAREDSIVVTRP